MFTDHGLVLLRHLLDELIPEPGAFYVMDRGYVDFARLYRFVLTQSFFVTRTKAGIQLNRLQSRPVDRTTGLRSDHLVWLTTAQSAAHYPDRLRRVSYRDRENGKVLVFLTNNFDLPALSTLLERIEALALLGHSADLDAALCYLPAAVDHARLALINALGDLQATLNQAAQ